MYLRTEKHWFVIIISPYQRPYSKDDQKRPNISAKHSIGSFAIGASKELLAKGEEFRLLTNPYSKKDMSKCTKSGKPLC